MHDECRTSARVPAGHPCLAGHFPGQPMVPAVLLLELVLDALHAWRGPQWRLRKLVAAKFLLPLLPDERFEIVLCMTDTRLDFRCEREARLLAQGTWELMG
ncbi:MAG: hydroxymyristoyl-ACP dehydratase [Panacagrimonas sp.]